MTILPVGRYGRIRVVPVTVRLCIQCFITGLGGRDDENDHQHNYFASSKPYPFPRLYFHAVIVSLDSCFVNLTGKDKENDAWGAG